jgi:hypothetical protein
MYKRRLVITALVAAFLTAGGVVAATWESARRQRAEEVDRLVASFEKASLETPEQVEHVVANAESSERAVLFLHVDWAVMAQQHERFAEFILDFQQAHPRDGVGFHFVDCTPVTRGYAPLRELNGWQGLEDHVGGSSLIHGWGEVVWMEGGRVLQVKPILHFESSEELVRFTKGLLLGASADV